MPGVAAIVLGGSYARGTADRHSDIDLGLYYDSDRPFRVAELRSVARELDDRHLDALVTDFGGPGVNGGGGAMAARDPAQIVGITRYWRPKPIRQVLGQGNETALLARHWRCVLSLSAKSLRTFITLGATIYSQ